NHLCLSPEQLDRIKELASRNHRETRDLRYDLALKQMEMHKLFTDHKVGEAALLAKEKELEAVRQKLHEKTVRMMLDSRKILTAEQLATLDQMPPPPPLPGMPGPGMMMMDGPPPMPGL
ncbi:MAG: periplasmic heavy metal sensor, partial [Syntrophales bacterium]|nr:periplasmic heavy metal sensor [Syntrophales bacterium]